MVKLGVIDCGYRGASLVRAFSNTTGCQLVICSDSNEQRLKEIRSSCPGVQTTANYHDLLRPEIDAVVIASPLPARYSLGMACLNAGKHVMIEKPLSSTSREAGKLIEMAQKRRKVLMTGHSFRFNPEIIKIKEIIASGEIGALLQISSTRVELDPFQADMDLLWNLASHDITIITEVLGKDPLSVVAQAQRHDQRGNRNVIMITLNYDNGAVAFVQNSWLNFNKIHRIMFSGARKMLLYDDTNPTEKIKVYDKGIGKSKYYRNNGEFQFSFRYSDMYVPRIDSYNVLGTECRHFIECILKNKTPLSDGHSGLRIARILESAEASLQQESAAMVQGNIRATNGQ